MKKTMKFVKISVLALLVVLMSFAMFACSKKDDGYDIEYNDGKTQYSVSLDRNSADMIVGDLLTLKASYERVEGAYITWSSDNIAVASVDNGVVEALSNGEARITATYGDASASCTVKVTFGSETPSIYLSDNKLNLSMADNDYYTLSPLVRINGKSFNDGVFTYTSSDESKLKIENGKLIPIAVTDTPVTVTISATWRGLTVKEAPLLSTTITVSIFNNVAISSGTERGFFKVYTRSEFQGVNYANTEKLNPSLKINGNVIDNAEFTATVRDENIAMYDSLNKVIKGIKYGKTYLDVTAKYNGEEYQKSIEIYVERPVATFSKPAKYFSAFSGMLKDENAGYETVTFTEFLFGKNSSESVVEVTANGEEITVKDGRVLGVKAMSNGEVDMLLTVSSDYVSYEVMTTVYGAYLCHAADLEIFLRSDESPEYEGYVELGRNIDAKDFTMPKHKITTMARNGLAVNGFKGTLDGKGHTISRLKLNDYGLFASLTSATIKNIAFVDCTMTAGSNAYPSIFAFNVTDTTLQNVYVKCNAIKVGNSNCGAVVASNKITGGTFSNVFIENNQTIDNWGAKDGFYQVFGAFKFDTRPMFNNCLVISQAPLTTVNWDQAQMQVAVAQNISQNEAEEKYAILWDSVAWQLRRYWLGKSGLSEQQFKGQIADSNGVTYNYNVPFVQLDDEYKTLAKNRLITMQGVMSYQSMSELMSDSKNASIISSFSSEYWMIKNGVLTWGESTINEKSGVIVLDVGEATGKTVYGLSTREINAKAGDTITLPTNLTCPGLKFVCWKDAVSGNIVLNTFNYDGSAMHLVAIWEEDDSFIQTPVT